ncbi:PR domain zinc finger protein 8 [Lynx canadensis]|uniref:PR domain zinc finger protein 8 n=1 Tax=Lynx canadensis TaxID=61383 RepID=A0A667G4M8_LYNCA|nr:PR domain zinc finger protein 8 [Lynx canadensis]XP_030169468.1 PR domain zinc finger protein 8 [Lynx canadensis]
MEDSGIQRGIWDGDAKAVQQCLTDIFTSVYTTCDIPENAIFGPCILSHTSLYDSIAFIALKSTDKRTVPYIFRVDTSAANGSSEGLMWLRLVQSARDKEEQNLEAYIKNGQLFYRSLRRIAKDEELLVWYGKELTELLLLCPSRSHSKMNGSSPYTCLECSQRFQFEFPYVAHLRFRCPKRLHSADASPQEEQGGGVGTKDHGGGGGGKDQQPQQQEAPLGPGPKFGKAGPIHHYPAPSPEGSNQPAAGGGGGAKPSTDFHNLARELENSGGGNSCSPVRGLGGGGGGGGGGHQEAELSPDGNATGGGKGKRKFPEEAAEGGGGVGLAGGRGRFAERPLTASKEDLVCTPQQYRASGSYFSLEENGRLFAPPSPETGEAKRSAFVEVKKAARAAGLQEDAAADGGGAAAEDQDAGGGGGGGGSSTPVAASPAGADKLLAPRPGGPLPGRLEGGSPARGSAFTSVPQLGGAGGNGAGGGAGAGASGGAGGGQGAASDERKSAFSQPARSFSQLSPLVLGQKLSALEPCHPGDGVGPTRLYPAASDPLAVKLQGAADLNGGCGALPSGGGGGLPKQNPFLYATAFWPKSSAAAAAAAAAAAGPLQLQLPSALTLLPPSFTSLCLPAQNWCAKCNASFRMTSDLVYHMRSHHKKEYAMEPLVKRRREEKLKCPICNESFRERHHLSRHMTSHN